MPFTDYLDQSLASLVFSNTGWVPPAIQYLGVSTSSPTQAVGTTPTAWNFTEVTGAGYARAGTAANATNWGPVETEPTSGFVIQTLVEIAMPQSAGPWSAGAPLSYFGLFDAATGGRLLAFGAIDPVVTVPGAAYILTFAAGQLTVDLD
jgi:hypothetical protein